MGNLPQHLQISEIESAYGANHPYTYPYRFFYTGRRTSAINQQIRRIGEANDINAYHMRNIMAQLARFPRED
jgi:hypothetical protein